MFELGQNSYRESDLQGPSPSAGQWRRIARDKILCIADQTRLAVPLSHRTEGMRFPCRSVSYAENVGGQDRRTNEDRLSRPHCNRMGAHLRRGNEYQPHRSAGCTSGSDDDHAGHACLMINVVIRCMDDHSAVSCLAHPSAIYRALDELRGFNG